MWVAQQALEDKWPKDAVGRVLCGKDAKNRVLFEMLDPEIQKEVASFDKARTCSAIPYLVQGNLLQWLYQEAVNGRWEQSMVLKYLTKQEVDGKTVAVSRIKPGKRLIKY